MKISLTVVWQRMKAALRGNRIARVRSANHVRDYLDKVLRVSFTLFALLAVVLSVVLDKFFNDRPVRFIPFTILAPSAIFFGILASGWFPRFPLWFISILKGHGFLKHVSTCSPWHDNIVTNFTGPICTLKSMVEVDSNTSLRLPSNLPSNILRFLYSDQLNLEEAQDGTGPHHSEENINPAEETVVQFSGDGDRWVTFPGPNINTCPLQLQVYQSMSLFGDTFELSYTFRNSNNKSESKFYLSKNSLENLLQNMGRWVENPYPILIEDGVEKKRGILHCMTIHDILWEFTKDLYTFQIIQVQDCYLAGEIGVKRVLETICVIVSSMLGLIPLAFQAQSVWFLFLSVPILLYGISSLTGGIVSNQLCYFFKSLLCPVLIKFYGFKSLYKSGSPFTWCNEFRKQRVVNPKYFLISQEYSNGFLHEQRCYKVTGPVVAPNTTPEDELICLGWPEGHPQKRHLYKLSIKYDAIEGDRYTNVKLLFSEKDDLLDDKFYISIETKRLQLIQKVFSYYSDPTFGGYVATISPSFRSYLAHCPRFLEVCDAIISRDTIPILLVAERRSEFNLVIGESLLSSNN